MLLTYKQKIKLNQEQLDVINNTSNEARLLYNFLLEKKNCYYQETKKSLSYYELQKLLKDYDCKYLTYDIKKEVCRLLDSNFKSFFNLLKTNKELNPQPPKFRGRRYFFTLSYTQDFIVKDFKLLLSSKLGKVSIDLNKMDLFNNSVCKLRNKSENILKQCKLYKIDDEYFISIMYEVQEKQVISSDKFLSIDLGKKNLITYYDEQTKSACNYKSEVYYKNEKYFDKRIDELKGLRDKKKKGSNKWKKLNRKKRTLEKKKNRQNILALHKLSKELSKLDRDIIIGELSNLKPNIVSEYRKMNRQMQNNWQLQTFTNLLEYKCEKEGRKLIKVNEAWTSKTCYKCGNINYDLTPNDRTYKCSCCGEVIDRDVNGAINILKVYKTKLGDYSTPLVTNVTERYFGDFHYTNKIFINL